MPTRISNKQFMARMRAVHSRRIIFHGEYITDRTRIPVECRKCGHTWQGRPSDLSRGVGCASCNGALKTTREGFVAKLDSLFGGRVELVGPYININAKLNFRCECGSEYERVAYDMLKAKHPCSLCYHRSRVRLDTETFWKFRCSVSRLTQINYEQYAGEINPQGVSLRRTRGRVNPNDYEIDHMYSVHDAYMNPKGLKHPVTIHEVAHPANLQILTRSENCRKRANSSFGASKLRRRIADFNRRLKSPRALS